MDWTPGGLFQTSSPCDEPQEVHRTASERSYQASENQLIQHHPWQMVSIDHTFSTPSQNDHGFDELPERCDDFGEGGFLVLFEASTNHVFSYNPNIESNIRLDVIDPLDHNAQCAWESSEMVPQEDEVDLAASMMLDDYSTINVGLQDSGGFFAIPEQSTTSDVMMSSPEASVSFAGPSTVWQMSSNETTATSEDQAISEPITTSPTSQPSATRKTIRSAKKLSHSGTKWDELRRGHLNRLYIRGNHTLDEVVFELAAIHNIEIGCVPNVKSHVLREKRVADHKLSASPRSKDDSRTGQSFQKTTPVSSTNKTASRRADVQHRL
ncbi:hypothetical protein CSAL01_01975 [Colletotrichum salicis]|uniref:Clr5 domain-containing protein n=1 Tax=Colletotrichum salicis TaxID=1209931 RepID=A0A135TCC3_9PEZI|nr:hypothetical protein CSAL01_01975 [Colletotrichum salicis]